MSDYGYILYPIVFLYGIVIGSFLNVCIYRLPEDEGIVKERSHCMSCGHKLSWYDLFPVFSWICLRGKCRYCGEKISVQYPVIEAINGLLWILTIYVNGWNADSVLWCVVVSSLLVLTVIDFRTMMIPVGTYIIILMMGVIHLILHRDIWYDYVIGGVFAGAFLFIIALLFRMITGKSGLGLGDIELMACAGVCMGFWSTLFSIIIGSVGGAVCEGIRMAVTKKKGKFAFGPYLAVAIYICLLWGDDIYTWYASLMGMA